MTGRSVTITGAAGFLGRRVVATLATRGFRVRAVTRNDGPIAGASDHLVVGDLLKADLPALVAGADIVVNCAAAVHRTGAPDDDLDQRMNHHFAVALGAAAKRAGAKRLVQMSSVAAITSHTRPGEIVTDAAPCAPDNRYGISKRDADDALAAMIDGGFSVVSLRPPAIIGAGARAWFGLLDRAARTGMPLPIGRIENRRSFAFVDNVADAVATAAQSERSGAFIVTDSDPMSSAALYRRLLSLHGQPDRVWPWPPGIVRVLARIVLQSRASSLVGNAAYDGARFRRCFGWTPPTSLERGLEMLARPA